LHRKQNTLGAIVPFLKEGRSLFHVDSLSIHELFTAVSECHAVDNRLSILVLEAQFLKQFKILLLFIY